MCLQSVNHLLDNNYKQFILRIFLGAYTPLTLEGNIVVDGVLASCYTSVNHDLGHLATAPIRWFPRMMEWVVGECNGLTIFANIAEEIGIWIVPPTALY